MAYFGGKTILAPQIASLLPPHGHYVEPYAGSLAVLLAKQVSPHETVNDIDGNLMLFWRMLRDRPEEFIRVCALTPHSRAGHQEAYEPAADDLERARRYWVRITQGRGGTALRTGWRHYVKPAGPTSFPAYLDAYVERMHAVAARLRRVSLECQPAEKIIQRYGRHPQVALYVDPPYLGSARSTPGDPRERTRRYAHEMHDPQAHEALAKLLLECEASVLLSAYRSPLYDSLYAGWHTVEFQTGTGQSARGEWSRRTEVIYSNRPLS